METIIIVGYNKDKRTRDKTAAAIVFQSSFAVQVCCGEDWWRGGDANF